MLTWGRLSDEQQMLEAKGLLEYWKFNEAFIEILLADPPDDYVGDLIRISQADERELTIDEITDIVYGLVLAGHETTTSMSSNAILTLMQHRDVWQRLCVEPEAIPNAAEELMRFNSSVITWRRKTTRPMEISGVAIPEGANLLLALRSGNHDDVQFAEADKFDIDRPNIRSYLSFGFGIHFCLGAPLVRLGAQNRSRRTYAASYRFALVRPSGILISSQRHIPGAAAFVGRVVTRLPGSRSWFNLRCPVGRSARVTGERDQADCVQILAVPRAHFALCAFQYRGSHRYRGPSALMAHWKNYSGRKLLC